jgi:hypothetical protein
MLGRHTNTQQVYFRTVDKIECTKMYLISKRGYKMIKAVNDSIELLDSETTAA